MSTNKFKYDQFKFNNEDDFFYEPATSIDKELDDYYNDDKSNKYHDNDILTGFDLFTIEWK